MPSPTERIAAAMRFFFEQALPQASGKRFADLPNPLVHVGAYAAYTGQAITTAFGTSFKPKFTLRVMPALAAPAGTPQMPTEIPTTGGIERQLLWLRQAADHKVDSEEEIRRVMADVESISALVDASPADRPGDGGAPPATPAGAAATAGAALRAAEWARGIIGARSALPDDLGALTNVPQPLTALVPDVEALRAVMRRFFTYDASGKYYARWTGAGRDAANPAQLHPEYKADNVREILLEREALYVYAVLPESVLAPGGALNQTALREVVIRLDPTGVESPPFALATVHTARWRRSSAPYCDFVFVYTQDGIGVQQARESRQKMSTALQALLTLVEGNNSSDELLQELPYTLKKNDVWHVSLTARIDGAVTFPSGVLAQDPIREWSSVQAPLDKLGELAALPAVKYLGVTAPPRKSNDLARAEVKFAALEAKIAVATRGGKGVLVGIIDSGIDGSHPAFGSRLHAVWDQDPPAAVTGKDPAANHPSDNAYKLMNFGVELTKTSSPSKVADSVDADGHGTHVSSIAAGAEVKDAAGKVLVPAGLAPEATVVVVRSIGGLAQSDWVLGLQYIFTKAKELGLPCVVNMSFGHHFHGHDGSDTDARKIFDHLTDPTTKKYLPGRIVVAAAGNERNDPGMHTRRSVPKVGPGSYRRLSTISLGSRVAASNKVRLEQVVLWIRNPLNVCPVNFPVGLVVYRQKTASTFDVTRRVMLGETKHDDFVHMNTRISISSQAAEHVNGDYSFEVTFSAIDATKTMVRSDWSIALDNRVDRALDVHLWIPQSRSTFTDATAADQTFLVGAPADGASAISVAASATRLTWTDHSGTSRTAGGGHTMHEIAAFSSPGPLRDASIPVKRMHGVAHEVNSIDVTAPGCFTLGALSSQWAMSADELWTKANARGVLMAGTSMASPLVAGLVANLLAEEPALTLPDVLERLKRASSIPAASKFQPPPAVAGVKPYSNDWGYGLVDASKLKP